MSYLVFVLGLLLAICGAASMSFGYGIINVERGWATFIGGATALSGGVVTMALAMILHSLSRLRAVLAAQRDARAKAAVSPLPAVAETPVAAAMAPSAEQAAAIRSEAGAGAAAKALSADISGHSAAPSIAHASIEDIRRVVADSIKHKTPGRHVDMFAPPVQDKEPAQDFALTADLNAQGPSRRASFGLPRAVGLKDIAPQHFSSTADPAVSTGSVVTEMERGDAAVETEEARRGTGTAKDFASSLRDRPAARAALAQTPQPEAARALPEKRTKSPRRGEDKLTVIGRYELDGTSYVMFADGSIDVQTERGAFRFASMAELKAFMDAQARGDA